MFSEMALVENKYIFSSQAQPSETIQTAHRDWSGHAPLSVSYSHYLNII